MSAPTALYRRYRPDSFADVIGQEHVTAPLMTALDKNRVNHAYLFSGPRGCGKTTSARILARCLNCAQGPTSHPCGTCDSCIELARGGTGSLDVIEIDAASHGGVDDARDLRERATFAPIRDRYKIFIIDEAHMVTSAGFNALLKIVEEPPEHIKFIFATTEPDKVIGTIRSRTHHYPFRLVPPEPLMAYLAHLCEQENVPVAPGVLSLVIRAGGGSVRDSLSVLDQLMAGAGAAGLDYDLAVDLLGYTHSSLLDDVVEALAAADSATVFKSVDRVIQTGHDPRRFVEDLLERFRDLIIVQAMPESAHAILRGTPDELIARMQTQAAQLGAAELSRAADVTNTAFNEMTGATSPRLHLELLGARLLLPGADASARGMAARLDQLERRLNYGAVPASPAGAIETAPFQPAPVPSAPSSPSTTPYPATSAPVTSGGGLAAVRAKLAKAKEAAGAEVANRHKAEAGQAPAESTPTTATSEQPDSRHSMPTGSAATSSAAPAAVPTWADLPSSPVPERTAEPSSWQNSNTPAVEEPSNPVPAQSAPEAVPTAISAPAPASTGSSGIEVIRRAWPEILGNLSNIRKASWAMVNQNVVPRAFDGQILRIALPTTALIQAFGNGGHADNLRQAIHTTLGITCQLDPITGDAPTPGSSAEPNPKELANPRFQGQARAKTVGSTSTNAPLTAVINSAVPATNPAPASVPAPAPVSTPAAIATPVPPVSDTPAEAGPSTSTPIPARPTISEWTGPIPEEPNWDDEPPRDDWEPAESQPSTSQPSANQSPVNQPSTQAEWSNAVPHEEWEQRTSRIATKDFTPAADSGANPSTNAVINSLTNVVAAAETLATPAEATAGTQENSVQENSVQEISVPEIPSVPEPVPYRPKVSPISAWTTGWDTPEVDTPAVTPDAETPATPRRSQLLAQQSAQADQQDSPQDWGVSLGATTRNRVADPGWGAPSNAPDWAQPDPSPVESANNAVAPTAATQTSATPDSATQVTQSAQSAQSSQGVQIVQGAQSSQGVQQGESQPSHGDGETETAAGERSVSVAPASSLEMTPATAPANGASREKLSMYQRLSNSPEAQAGRTQAPARAANIPYVEDVPSPDDVTIEESGVVGQAAVERILGGVLIEERSLSGN